jgi:outer membrane protein W
LAIGLPNDHPLWRDAAAGSGKSALDAIATAAHFLTLKYQFRPERRLRPYLGLGIGHLQLHEQDSPAVALSRNSWGPVAQAGIDLTMGKHWLFNADLKYSRIRPDIRMSGVPAGNINADPLFIGAGFGYRFGVRNETPASATTDSGTATTACRQ